MAHGLRLRGGKAEWFRSRFVLDRNAARVLSRKPLSGPSEGTRDGNVNTNLMNVGGTHDYGRGRMTAEPVFVRKAGATAEDEGWIMSYVYDPERDLSDVVILDAQDFSGEPVATVRLPVPVPFGFHGGWAPDKITVVE